MGDQGCADAEISASIACTNYGDQLAYRRYQRGNGERIKEAGVFWLTFF